MSEAKKTFLVTHIRDGLYCVEPETNDREQRVMVTLSAYDAIAKERDKWKDEYFNLAKFTDDLEDDVEAKDAIIKEAKEVILGMRCFCQSLSTETLLAHPNLMCRRCAFLKRLEGEKV